MAIHLDILARLNERSLRDAARRADDAGSRMQRSMDHVADATGRVRVEQEKLNRITASGSTSREQLIRQQERLASAQRTVARVARDAARTQLDLGQASRDANRDVVTLNNTLSLLGKSGRAFGTAGLAPALITAGSAAATAAGALALLPAAAGAGAAAFGTLKIATLGFGDAMDSLRDPEEFAKSLQSLSPNAQQAALSIRNLLPEFDKLKNATQDALFDGVGEQLHNLTNQFLPTIQNMTTGIADAFNTAFQGVSDQLMSLETQSAIQNLTTNITAAFQNMAPAAAPLAKAVTDIMSVGSDFLPGLATAAANAATSFSEFITEAMQSGQLKQWIEDGLATMKQLGDIILDVGRAFSGLLPVAQDVLPVIADAVRAIADVLQEHPGLIWAVVGAFAAWKTIEGVAALTTALTSISTILGVSIPAAAGVAAAALAPLAGVAAAVTVGVAAAVAGQQRLESGGDIALPAGDVGGMPILSADGGVTNGQPVQGPLEYSGGGGSFATSRGALDGIHGTDGSMPTPAGLAPWQPIPVPTPTGNAGGPRLPDAPVLPYGNMPTGAPTAALYSAEASVVDAQHNLAEKRARLTQLEGSNAANANDIQDARNDVAKAEQAELEAKMRRDEAWKSASEKGVKQLNSTSTELGQIGAQLDSDFGISKGLAGIAENLTKFIANLAAAPLLGQLNAISAASPSQGGYGVMGVLGAQGAFGPQYTGINQGQQAAAMGPTPLGGGRGAPLIGGGSPGVSSGQPYGLPGSTNTGGYGSSGAVFPPWVHALEQQFGVKASTYAGHQADNRNEPGYAPNPNGENRGIDWSGPVGAMQKFADYLSQVPGSLEQVIWQNPNTGQATEIAGGRPQPGYFSGDLGGHQDHVHTRQSSAIPTPGGGPSPMPVGAPGGGVYPATSGGWGGPGLPNLPAGAGGRGYMGSMPGGGIGASAAATPIGARVAPPSGTGQGGIGITPGGSLDSAMGIAASMFPGAGQAAQTVAKLGSRAIQYGGEVAGIGAQGLMETFLPMGGSELASNNWLTRIVGGLAGAAPALPNMAGKAAAPTPEQVANVDPNTQQHGQGQGQPPGPTYNTTINTNRDTISGTARDWEYHTQNMYAGPGS